MSVSEHMKDWEMKLFYCFFKSLKTRKFSQEFKTLKLSLNLKLWWKKFVIVNHIGFPTVMAVKLEEHVQIHEYF